MNLTEAFIENGELSFINEVPEVEPTSETNGNVTIKNMGSPGVPAYFEVSFRVNATFEADGINSNHFLSLRVVVPGGSKDRSFREVEAEAARQVAPMLHSIADQIGKQVAEYDQKHAE